MKGNRFIIYIFIPVLAGLLSLLCWNCVRIYRFEKKQVQEKVETAIDNAAYAIQWYNGSLISNYAIMLTDKDFDSKLAFAAGFTHNKSKFSKFFFEDDTVPKSPGADTNIISGTLLKNNKISYNPNAVMTIQQFDSLFKRELDSNRAHVNYKIVVSKHADTAESKDIIVSQPFIIDFFAPRMYSIHYSIPANLVLRNMLVYLACNLLLCALLIFGAVFYYHSYKVQIQLREFRESVFGNITHELKTPLTSMQLILDSAKKDISGGNTVSIPSGHVLFAEKELNRMKLIVDRILSFNKMSQEQFAFNKERVDLDHVISEAITAMEINLQQAKGVINYSAGDRVIVLGDPILLANLTSVIIDNAIKYSHKPPEINIKLERLAQKAIIAIQDNGIGIPLPFEKKIFDPFFRIPTGNVYNSSGHGLGLSFAKQVMTLHHGDISFSSNENGTTFYLTFKML